MAISTLEGLEGKISRDLAWRKREILGLRTSIANTADAAHLCRAGLVMICAHWEGFLKRAVDLYVEHVFARKLRIKDLSATFVAVAYFSEVQKSGKANYPGSVDTHVRLAERIKLGIDAVCDRSSWEANTEGNPGTDVVGRLLSSIGVDVQMGFDQATWSTTRIFIDEQIVADRHRVAHGEGFPLTPLQFVERSQRVLDLLDRLSQQVLDAAAKESYLADNARGGGAA